MNTNKIVLNAEQKQAVKHGEGPLLIIAGAGTGKTTVITERIKHLILQRGIKSSEILALTFTEKAAREMEERVDVAMPYGYTQMWISTFHAFCDRILRNEAVHIGLNPSYRLMTTALSVQFFRRYLFDFKLTYFRPLGNPTKFVHGLLQHISRLKDEDILPSQYIAWAKNAEEEKDKWQELARVYKQYESLKAKEGLMDFADLISNTLFLFRKRPVICRQYSKQFNYILVDEFQDTNIAQYELIKLLAPIKANPSLTVVGDDSQSIYKFRGAAVSNILSFMKDYPASKQIILMKNYRSTQTILDSAYKLIKHNDPDTLEARLGISKNLEKVRRVKESSVDLLYADRVEQEADKVVRSIEKKMQKNKRMYRDFALLVRANAHAEPFIRALKRAGVPYQFLGPGMLFRQAEVKDLIAYLKFLADVSDSVSLYRVLCMDIFNISPRDLAIVLSFTKRYNLTLFEACEQLSGLNHQTSNNIQLPFVSQKTREQATVLVNMIHRHLERIHKDSAGQILYYFLEDSGLLKAVINYETAEEERKIKNISRFFDKLKTYETEHEDASVSAVVAWLELSLELGESPIASDTDWSYNNAVNILTVHSSKGLEFPIVFLVNLTTGRFPTYERREQIPIPDGLIKETLPEGDYHEQEERRLFYVGMTRARDKLYFTASHYYGEGKRERKLSPFVGQALGEGMVSKISALRNAEKRGVQLSILDWKGVKEKKEAVDQKIIKQTINYLSYSQIETYTMCPLKYKYRYIVRVPTPPTAAASFGQSVHEALRAFYEIVRRNEKVTSDLLTTLLEQKWIPLGYRSYAHEARMKQEGKAMLANFYKTAFDPKQKIISLEQFFVVRVTPNLKIAGKIDRVDSLNNKLEIIDYKTGRVPSQKEIDNSLQMTVYALAAVNKGIFNQKAENLILSFYFLQGQKKLSTERTTDQLREAKEKLVKVAKDIGTSKFAPKVGRYCDFCEYKFICPAWEE